MAPGARARPRRPACSLVLMVLLASCTAGRPSRLPAEPAWQRRRARLPGCGPLTAADVRGPVPSYVDGRARPLRRTTTRPAPGVWLEGRRRRLRGPGSRGRRGQRRVGQRLPRATQPVGSRLVPDRCAARPAPPGGRSRTSTRWWARSGAGAPADLPPRWWPGARPARPLGGRARPAVAARSRRPRRCDRVWDAGAAAARVLRRGRRPRSPRARPLPPRTGPARLDWRRPGDAAGPPALAVRRRRGRLPAAPPAHRVPCGPAWAGARRRVVRDAPRPAAGSSWDRAVDAAGSCPGPRGWRWRDATGCGRSASPGTEAYQRDGRAARRTAPDAARPSATSTAGRRPGADSERAPR